MCEIFGITAEKKVHANELLREFFSHSCEHRDGWGLVVFDAGYPAVEKEPVAADKSVYLKARLEESIDAAHMAAHIRRATSGVQEYDNTHPFVKRDPSGRMWTLVHNGHIFEGPMLRKYLGEQNGSTDSERILCCIVDEMARVSAADAAGENARAVLVDRLCRELSPENKLNIILFDGELMYVHTNEPGGLHIRSGSGSKIFSTKPLTADGWEKLPINRLHVYKDAEEIYTGEPHGFTYTSDHAKEQELYINYSML